MTRPGRFGGRLIEPRCVGHRPVPPPDPTIALTCMKENSPGEEPQYLKPGEGHFLIPRSGPVEEDRQSPWCKSDASILVPKRDNGRF